MVKFQPSKLAMRVRFPLPAPTLPVKTSLALLIAFAGATGCARADLTIMEKVEGPAPTSAITIKIKGDQAKIEATPKVTTIIDAKTGQVTNWLNDRKLVLRMPAERVRAALEKTNRIADKTGTAETPKLVATGQKAMINGYETEEYTFDTGKTKTSFWVAPKYPDAAAILKQLHVLNAGPWKIHGAEVPDYNDLPGVPLKFVSTVAGRDLVTTVTTINEEPLSDSEFAFPPGFQEMKGRQIDRPVPQLQKSAVEPPKP